MHLPKSSTSPANAYPILLTSNLLVCLFKPTLSMSPSRRHGIRTHHSNSSKHPGVPDKPSTRRSSAEVKVAAEAKEAAKKLKMEAQQARIQRVAEFERRAMTNEDLIDATPQPNFKPHATQPDYDTAHMSDGDMLAPGESDDSESVMKLVLKRKKVTPAAGKTKPLTTIAKNSADDSLSEPILLKPIMEVTDSDGDGPPLRN